VADKIKLFLSSRVNSSFKKLDATFSLADLRGFLKKELASPRMRLTTA
jgi:hypothetical protein